MSFFICRRSTTTRRALLQPRTRNSPSMACQPWLTSVARVQLRRHKDGSAQQDKLKPLIAQFKPETAVDCFPPLD